RIRIQNMAEGEGFEPPKACTLVVFKTTAIDHSAIPPARTNNTASYPARRRLTLRVRPGWPSQTTPGTEMSREARCAPGGVSAMDRGGATASIELAVSRSVRMCSDNGSDRHGSHNDCCIAQCTCAT